VQRRAFLPLTGYAVVAAVHLALIAFDLPGRAVTKALLMPALLAAVLVVALRGRAARSRAVLLLGAGIVASWVGDVLLGVSFVVGLAAFALAHLAYVTLFVGPARRRRIAWPALAYLVWLAVLVPVLWPHLGSLAPAVVVYGLLLAATAATATGVNATTAWGALAFLASDSLLAFRLFWPNFGSTFPDPWQDLAIMTLYCVGQGVIALGIVREVTAGGGGPGRAAGDQVAAAG
jgi:uncharacterized membrane protein YhhN